MRRRVKDAVFQEIILTAHKDVHPPAIGCAAGDRSGRVLDGQAVDLCPGWLIYALIPAVDQVTCGASTEVIDPVMTRRHRRGRAHQFLLQSADILPLSPALACLMGDTALPIAAGHELIGGANKDIDPFKLPG